MKMSDIKPRRRVQVTLPLALLLLLPPVYLLLTRPLPRITVHTSATCPYSIVYNKPHKTAGTKIQVDIVDWAKTNHWTAVTCSPFEPNIQMHECVPESPHGCVIVANHMVLDDNLEKLFTRKLGQNIRWMTSTRSGRERRLSHFLQINKIKHDKVAIDDLKNWLRGVNPWSDYNYMTGELRNTRCPVTWHDQQIINRMVSKYDIVIDADLPDISNVILKHFGLFQLTDSFVNVKGASKLDLDEEGEELVKKASCIDEEMHRQFRIRMGSLYEMITGVACNNRSREATPCF